MKLPPLPFAGLLAAVLLPTACAGMRPVELSPSEVQRQIRSGELLSPDDHAKFVMSNGEIHEFRIVTRDIGNDAVTGDQDSVQIADIVAVETKEIGTAGKAGRAVFVYALAILVIAVGTAVAGPF